jgi:hypothetical protein
MGKTYIAICATAALGLCLMAPKDASALPAADGAGKALSAVAGKSAVTQVRYVRRVGAVGFRRGIGYRRIGYGLGYRRFGLGYGLGYQRFGFGAGLGAAGAGCGYGHVRFVPPGTSFCTCGWSWYGNSQDCACGYY